MDDEDDIGAPEGQGEREETEEAEYAFEGFRIAFNRRVALTPPAAAAPARG